MLRLFVIACLQLASSAVAGDEVIKSPSPDGRYALRLVKQPEGIIQAAIIDAKSRRFVADKLKDLTENHLNRTQLIWSADSRRVAYACDAGDRSFTQVFFCDGLKFAEVELPELPLPKVKKPKEGIQRERFGYDNITPLRWLNSGSLELCRNVDLIVTSEDGADTHLGKTLTITISFDGERHASVKKVVRKQD